MKGEMLLTPIPPDPRPQDLLISHRRQNSSRTKLTDAGSSDSPKGKSDPARANESVTSQRQSQSQFNFKHRSSDLI